MTTTRSKQRRGIGQSVVRPDGVPKVTGNFAYASDLWADNMLWAATRHAPHGSARIVSIDTTPALAIPGVQAVLTQQDVPGKPTFGQINQDQPVFASERVNYYGEPIAVVAADDAETARLAAAAIEVVFEALPAVTDVEVAHDAGSIFREFKIRRGDPNAAGSVVVEGVYETPFVDQAPLGTEAGLAIPDGEGGVDLYATTQWVHVDHEQIIECMNAAPDQIRCHPVGIGGAFGAREDISLHIHLCMLALRTGRPVKMVYDRAESFVGHVKRHKAKMWFRHEADDQGNLVKVTARVLLDGGAYTHTSPAVLTNAAYFTVGPYRCDNVVVDAAVMRTNNPPCGAMRGFGSVQSCFGHESQMDRLAAALDLHPLEIRRRNALEPGQPMATSGQIIEGSLPTLRVIDALEAIPLPEGGPVGDPRLLPGGTGLTTPASAVVRGVGYAVGLKNLAFSEAFDDYAEARIILHGAGAEVHTAAIEVGQGMVTVLAQIAREILDIESVVVLPADTSQIGSAGSTSASRQTQMSGGAVHMAATELRDLVLDRFDGDRFDGAGVWRGEELVASLEQMCSDAPIEHHVRFRHPPTEVPDENGQGRPHAGFAVAAHRAVVDVDPELGLVRVVQVDTAQDVGVALNPQSVIGQIEGGIMQGVGLAVMEELIVDESGIIRNGTFTDYLLPTFLDAPPITAEVIEEPNNWGPFGAKGVGEPPTISSTPAVVAAIRAATGRELPRVPVRPQDIVGDLAADPTPS